jgi:type I restriction enzyme M protein
VDLISQISRRPWAGERAKAELQGKTYNYIIEKPYRWSAWAAPKKKDGSFDHDKALTGDDLIKFVDEKLFPYLKGFRTRAESPNTIEYKIGEIFSEIENKFRSGYSLRDALELVDGLSFRSQEQKHELSELYEGKLRNMGNAGRNGGEYYTPRPLIRAMIQVVKPTIGERIYDGACGSAGFLCESFEYMTRDRNTLSTKDMRTLQEKTFYGKEKKSLAYIIGIMNMILHGIEAPNIVHTNTLAENISDIQERPFWRRAGQSAVRRQGASRGLAEFPDQDRRDCVPIPPALHQVAEGRWPCGNRH